MFKKKFEILCVTMRQKDFSKIREMNIHSDIVYANQSDRTMYEEMTFDGHTAKMISTETRGVGINRNLALIYADAEICLFADDDVRYVDNVETIVTQEFEAHPDADVFIFNVDTSGKRTQKKYFKTRKCKKFEKMPWGGVRIAVRLSSLRKANIHFTTLFGGGTLFPSGEDSMFLLDAKRHGLRFYVSKETVGILMNEDSSWFTGFDEKFFFGKGAFCAAMHPHTFGIWMRYYLWRYKGAGALTPKEKKRWMKTGKDGYRKLLSFHDYTDTLTK